MKTNLSYYSRRTDAYRHPKFKTLRMSYGGGTEGWAAEGRFWALNDIIAEADLCQIDLTKLRNKADIAETLGLSLPDLERFISLLISPDIELLFQIEPEIYSTKKVLETLDTVLVEREKARKRKGTPEKMKSSPELFESSPEPNNKGKERKGKESKEKESKGVQPHFFYETALNLFKSKTKIQNPSHEFHLEPICELFESVPEHLTAKDVENCIQEVFDTLTDVKSIRMEFVINNIKTKIAAKREKISGIKTNEVDKTDVETNGYVAQQLTNAREMFSKNEDLFSDEEKSEVNKYLARNDWVMASSLICAKIEEIPSL